MQQIVFYENNYVKFTMDLTKEQAEHIFSHTAHNKDKDPNRVLIYYVSENVFIEPKE